MSILNLNYATKDEIPAGYEALFTEKNGRYELTGVVGMQTTDNVRRLENALNAERNAHKGTKEKFKQIHFKGKSLAEMNDDELSATIADLDRFEELQASAGKIDDEKINQIVESRVKTKIAPVERERNQFAEKVKTYEQQIAEYGAKERQRTIHDAVRKAAAASKAGKFQASAIDDALLLAERVFDVTEEGAVTVRDQVGFTPGITPDDWMAEAAEKRPHWFEGSNGGGATGMKGNSNVGSKTMKRSAFAALSVKDQHDFAVNKGGILVDD